MTTTTRQHYLTADQLRPGDIVLDTQTKARLFAAFDLSVQVDYRLGPVAVRVWTAATDQANGVPAQIDLTPKAAVLVERRTSGPQVTHTTLTPHADGSVTVDRH